jgi:CheY-like chemotaxis protein/signal transduction histidine kinase
MSKPPFSPPRAAPPELPMHVLIYALLVLIFVVDNFTALGFAEWIAYMVPVGLTLLQSRRWAPFAVCTVATVMALAGLALSPPGVSLQLALVNRIIGCAAFWTTAVLVYQVIAARHRMEGVLWIQRGRTAVAQSMQGDQSPEQLSRNFLHGIARHMEAAVGAFYRLEGEELVFSAGYAFEPDDDFTPRMRLKTDRAGQLSKALHERAPVLVRQLPAGYLRVGSGLGATQPVALWCVPVMGDGAIEGVLELGFLGGERAPATEHELLQSMSESAAVGLRTARYRQQLNHLLEQTRRQSEELQAQQEELRVSNEELEEQSRVLIESQARLENQQAELEQTNVQLEEQTQLLERQKSELLQTQRALRANAGELERASRYKSEFLANMSHELRTPLNSSLILAQLLSENREGNLNDEQVRYARTIQDANNDLLSLINDILDLSKIEAGRQDVVAEFVDLPAMIGELQQVMDPIAQSKGLALRADSGSDGPAALFTDGQKLRQILKNLMSNAIKFTERGEVVLSVQGAGPGRVAFSVRDTGVGIAEHQHEVIFEAFRQADGTTSRKYGGSGLGLSISRELARLLGGDIRVQSAAGQGSTFVLELPVLYQGREEPAPAAPPARPGATAPMPAARPVAAVPVPPMPAAAPVAAPPGCTGPAARRVLLIEDDQRFSAILKELAHELEFDCVVADTGIDGLRLARELQPVGVLLDVGLPDVSGLSVLERLKRDPLTRHIPVHMVSVHDHEQTALELGAIGYVRKPVAREEMVAALNRLEERLRQRMRRVLVVEDDAALRENIRLLLASENVEINGVGTMAEALDALSQATFDCMVMDLKLPDGSGYDLLEKMAAGDKHAFPPVIVYTGGTLSATDEERLRRYSRSIIIKGAKSPERLLDEVTLFLHSVEASLPPDQQRLLRQARQRDAAFDGRLILLAEDDARNIFALTSVMENLGAKVEIARNGREALDRLAAKRGIDLVLMDVMMPEMDGLEAMRRIRAEPGWSSLPIIALTAKAMPEDRQRCLDAGANDYVSKPLDIGKLVSLCRVWMPK